ncbi:response regulator transcription factor, partial [candidate division KSB1 bacterium]|nr:response regulator transcription factor [candidate division KSB1 bacterium]
MKRILIIEDDPAILKGLQVALREERYEVQSESDGVFGYEYARNHSFDLILLDLMLPGKNGQQICRDLRGDGVTTPIIMLTSKKEEADKVLGLEIGADDYVTKPFSILELKARIRALLRRGDFETEKKTIYQFGKNEIDVKKLTAFRDNKPINLSAKEYEILQYFLEREGEVITRDMLLNDVWGYDTFPTTRTIDTFILNLRKKIEDDPS